MRYDRMRPHQIRDAIARNLPVVLPLGVLEYHGEHLPVGMDMLAVTHALDRLEAAHELVRLPAFPYGAASHAVAGPAGSGTLHIPSQALTGLAEGLFTALLRAGFRNIHAVIHHQTEEFHGQGMPTDLAFRLGARQAIFAQVEAERGPGWWGTDAMRQYYQGGGPIPSAGSASTRCCPPAPASPIPSITRARAKPPSCSRSPPTRSSPPAWPRTAAGTPRPRHARRPTWARRAWP